jgi:hypothetical protein
MGTTLEAGKIGVAMYLYRYWRLIPRLFKAILMTFLAVLMFIISVGIFGYLSQGYQKTSEEFKLITMELASLERELGTKRARDQEINRHIDALPSDQVRNKIRLAREFGDEQAEIRERLAVIEPRVQELSVKRLAYESHIGPISYVARMLDAPQDNIVFYAILLLVFVADPLAVTLTVACNMALIRFIGHRRTPAGRPVFAGAPIGFIDAIVERARTMALMSTSDTFQGRPQRPRRAGLWRRWMTRMQARSRTRTRARAKTRKAVRGKRR